jgi:PhzF family phenazine biosynthesis protein
VNLSDEVYTQVDAFTDSAFKGNPAAVCLLEKDKDDEWLQSLATEFNISETCYLTPIHGTSIPRFGLRWFTPVIEVLQFMSTKSHTLVFNHTHSYF